MSCDCLENIRKKLAEDHEGVEFDLTISGQTFTTGTCIKVIRGKKRRGNLHVFHDYCPWCGKPYDRPYRPYQTVGLSRL